MKKAFFSFQGLTGTNKKIIYNYLIEELNSLGYKFLSGQDYPEGITYLIVDRYKEYELLYSESPTAIEPDWGTKFTYAIEFLEFLKSIDSSFNVGDWVVYNNTPLTKGGSELPKLQNYAVQIVESQIPSRKEISTINVKTVADALQLNFLYNDDDAYNVFNENLKLATTEEIENTLLKVANVLYPKGTLYKSADDLDEEKIRSDFKVYQNPFTVTDGCGGYVFYGNVWATKVSEPKVEISTGLFVKCIEAGDKGAGWRPGKVFFVERITETNIAWPKYFFDSDLRGGVYFNSLEIATPEDIKEYIMHLFGKMGMTKDRCLKSVVDGDLYPYNNFQDYDICIEKGKHFVAVDGISIIGAGKISPSISDGLQSKKHYNIKGWVVNPTSTGIDVGCQSYTFEEVKAFKTTMEKLKVTSLTNEFSVFNSDDLSIIMKVINEYTK